MSSTFDALRLRFVARCADDLALIDRSVSDRTFQMSELLQNTIHRLSGSAGTFGFPALGDLAQVIDDDLARGAVPSLKSIHALADGLKRMGS